MFKALLLTLTGVAMAATPGEMIDSIDRGSINGLRAYVSNMSCDYYSDFEAVFNYCGPTGYVQNFGEKYCIKYLENRDEFEVKEWQDDVRKCLQDRLTDFAQS